MRDSTTGTRGDPVNTARRTALLAVVVLTTACDRGVEIVLLGFCDYDCKDLDLTLYDDAGNEVTTDVLTDDAPLLQLTPTSKGNYRLVVTMAICNDEPCRYGVQAFE